MNDKLWDFFTVLLPELIGLGKDLYEMFDGDHDAAKAELVDRRADIQRRRARNDAALRKKHGG